MSISKERLDEIKNIRDDQIDYSDIPQADEEWFKNAKLKMPKGKTGFVKLDDDVVNWYRSHEENYLARMNAILRAYMNKQKAHA